MKKLASAFIALSMSMIVPFTQVQASDVTLESAIASLQYRLTVEWDQKDRAVQKQILDQFADRVEVLKKQGVSDEQVFTSLAKSAFDAETATDLVHIAKYAKDKKLSQEDARKLMLDYANKSQKIGANISGDVVLAGLIIGVALAAVIILCSTGNCRSGRCYDDCYFDYWGYYVCDTYCY